MDSRCNSKMLAFHTASKKSFGRKVPKVGERVIKDLKKLFFRENVSRERFYKFQPTVTSSVNKYGIFPYKETSNPTIKL